MGQYYMPYVHHAILEETTTYNGHNFNDDGFGIGLKIMEHSWINCGGNPLLNAVCNLILYKPSVVAWVGDYSKYVEDCHIKGIEQLGEKNYKEICKGVWGDLAIWQKDPLQNKDAWEFDYKNYRYLINNTTKQFVDFERVIKENSFDKDEKNPDGWCVHPLSLLTATSNGKGGGDYSYKVDMDFVGIWAFCELHISDTLPDGFTELFVGFREGEIA
ncbi:MAG: hypothetical protein FWH03_05480 [Firmicutes bacterium]|nr:hypothetical protein [Bacillota bacterium]